MTDVQELAGKTAAEIRRRGLYKGGLYYEGRDWDNCRVCVIGGIAAAAGLSTFVAEHHPLVVAIALRVNPAVAFSPGAVISWNDDPRTSEADVLAVLDSIAAGK